VSASHTSPAYGTRSSGVVSHGECDAARGLVDRAGQPRLDGVHVLDVLVRHDDDMTGVPLPRAGADPGGGRGRLHDHVVVDGERWLAAPATIVQNGHS